jgi:hypothetical protein
MSPSPQQIQKQQSKQIKRQTKMMLKVEEARRDVQIEKFRQPFLVVGTFLHMLKLA